MNMWQDDDHQNYVRFETLDEFKELCGWVEFYQAYTLLKNGKDAWNARYNDIIKSIELFGSMNVSVHYDEYMKMGDGLDEFMSGFWINLKDAEYNDGCIKFETAENIFIQDGYLGVSY
jgi:hypothetical protein